jgi:hypothetical protein
MSTNQKIITQEIASTFLNGPHEENEVAPGVVAVNHPVQLGLFTKIDDDAAEILAEFVGCLPLCGLSTLTDAAALAFSKHSGDLDLRSLSSLSDEAAKHLSSHQGKLNLVYLGHISDEGVKHLSKLEYPLIIRLQRLTPDVAASLAQHPGGYLDIGGLKEIADDVAAELAQHVGLLRLLDLIRLSDVSAQHLSKHDGEIEFRMLREISEHSAKLHKDH